MLWLVQKPGHRRQNRHTEEPEEGEKRGKERQGTSWGLIENSCTHPDILVNTGLTDRCTTPDDEDVNVVCCPGALAVFTRSRGT